MRFLKTKPTLSKLDSLFVCVDIQEKLFNKIENKNILLNNANILLKGAEILDIDRIILEQYPKGLGNSVVNKNTDIIDKISFSAFGEQRFCEKLKDKTNIIFFGIESHICIRESAFDAIRNGFGVFVIEDSCASINTDNHHNAMNELKNNGINVTNTQSILFSFLLNCKDENFKNISSLIK